MRKHGLAVDNLLAADVVTAEGEIVRASADEHPELFWALRGGGGNFGVVTSFQFALHPVGQTVIAGPVFWAADDTADVLRFYRDFAADAPDELGTVVRLGTVPPLPVIAEELHWRPAIAVSCCYAGPVEDGERAVRALRRFGTPLVDLIGPKPYAAFSAGMDSTVPHGLHYYWKGTNLAGLSDDAIRVIADHAYGARSPRSYAAMFHMGGAVARVPQDATAFAHRDVAHNIMISAGWLPDQSGELAAAESAWARRFLEALQAHRAGSVYVNFLDSDDARSRVREAYPEQTYRRLAEIRPVTTPTTPSTTTRTSHPADDHAHPIRQEVEERIRERSRNARSATVALSEHTASCRPRRPARARGVACAQSPAGTRDDARGLLTHRRRARLQRRRPARPPDSWIRRPSRAPCSASATGISAQAVAYTAPPMRGKRAACWRLLLPLRLRSGPRA